jgi:hypothetical protein
MGLATAALGVVSLGFNARENSTPREISCKSFFAVGKSDPNIVDTNLQPSRAV